MKRLTEQVIRLQQAAEAICTDKAFVYDTIYLAVIKTKQKYKKLANKERAVDVCISLMKQPKKHVNQSFSSVEDCIEKALAAKTVPWKPILSAVAVVLVAAIILPFCLSREEPSIDVDGFIMDGSLSVSNRANNNETYVKNIHSISSMGGPLDPVELTGKSYGYGNVMEYDVCTDNQGNTYLACAYTDKYLENENASAKVVLYHAQTSGWLEVGSAPIGAFSDIIHGGETPFIAHNIGKIYLICDDQNNLYLISIYEEGLQIHTYSENAGFALQKQLKISDQIYFPLAGEIHKSNQWIKSYHIHYDPKNERIILGMQIYDAYHSYTHKSGLARAQEKFIFFDYSIQENVFSTPHSYNSSDCNLGNLAAMSVDVSGAVYFITTKELDEADFLGQAASPIGVCLYRINNGSIEEITLISDTNEFVSMIRLFAIRDDGIHIIYSTLNGATKHASVDNNGYKISYTVSSAKPGAQRRCCIGYFYRNDTLYCIESIDKMYIVVSTIDNKTTTIVAEFQLPDPFSAETFSSRHNLLTAFHNSIANILMEYNDKTYFSQIILK